MGKNQIFAVDDVAVVVLENNALPYVVGCVVLVEELCGNLGCYVYGALCDDDQYNNSDSPVFIEYGELELLEQYQQ